MSYLATIELDARQKVKGAANRQHGAKQILAYHTKLWQRLVRIGHHYGSNLLTFNALGYACVAKSALARVPIKN
jgi:hypothetical protein